MAVFLTGTENRQYRPIDNSQMYEVKTEVVREVEAE